MKTLLAKAAAFTLLAAMLLTCFCSCSGSQTLMTIDGNTITGEIMNYYAYISTSMLELYNEGSLDYDAEIEAFDGRRLGDVVKELAYKQILNDYACVTLARRHHLDFDKAESNIIDQQVDLIIAGIGDNATYRKFLNTVKISDKTYREMLRLQMLVTKVKNDLVEDGGPMALTEAEITAATETYKDQFVNVEYVLLTNRDLKTGDELDSTSVAEQKEVAKKVRALAVNGTDFHKLIDKYSANKPSDGYSAYIMKSDPDSTLPDEFISAAFALEDNAISPIVITDYGFYVIKRLPFDDYFPTVVKQTARDAKFDQAVKDAQESMTVVTTAAYGKYVIE